MHTSGGQHDIHGVHHDTADKPFIIPTMVGSTPASAGGDEPDALSASQKMISAVSGSLLTSLLGMSPALHEILGILYKTRC